MSERYTLQEARQARFNVARTLRAFHEALAGVKPATKEQVDLISELFGSIGMTSAEAHRAFNELDRLLAKEEAEQNEQS